MPFKEVHGHEGPGTSTYGPPATILDFYRGGAQVDLLKILWDMTLHGNTRDGAREKLFLPALSRAKFDPRSLVISGERRGQRTCPRVSPCVLVGLAWDFSREMASPGSLPGGSPGFSPGIGLSGPLLCRVCPRTSPRERRVCPRTSPRPSDTDLSPGSPGPPGSLWYAAPCWYF